MLSSSWKVVRMSTRTAGQRSLIRRVASMPSMPGMRMSMSTASGRALLAGAHGARAVARRADDLHVGFARQEHLQAPRDQRIVVDHEDLHAAPASSRAHGPDAARRRRAAARR